MTVLATVLLGFAVVVTVGGPVLLRKVTRWCAPASRGPLVVWTLAPVGWLLAWVGAGVGIVAGLWGMGVKGVITACLSLVHTLHGGVAGWVGLLVVAGGFAAVGRLLWVVARHVWQRARWRRRQRHALALGARRQTVRCQRVWVVDSATPDAYCMPGAGLGVVVTRGAVEALTPRQLDAVLAHEYAHLRGRHHVVVAWVRLLRDAFPWVPLLRAAAEEVAELVEWVADDYAVRQVGVGPLAHAVGVMAVAGAGPAAPAVLAASGASPVRRVRRLVRPPVAGAWGRRLVCVGVGAALVVFPVVASCAMVVGVVTAPCGCVG